MSLPRPARKLFFIEKIGSEPVEKNADEFAKERGFEWSDEMLISDKDKKRILEEKDQIFFSTMNNPAKTWATILASHEKMHENVAIYDTGDACGLGLMAINPLSICHFLKFSGEWSFPEYKDADGVYRFDSEQDTSYSVDLRKKDSTPYGRINGLKLRHFATFMMHAEEPHSYTFQSSSRDKIALENMEMFIISRPEEVKFGPPLLSVFQPIRDIRRGEPLIWKYSDTFFLEKKTNLTEKFFNRLSGAVIEPSCYTINEYKIRVLYKDNCIDLTYNKQSLMQGKPLYFSVPTHNLFFYVEFQDIQEAIKAKPHSRYIRIPEATLVANSEEELDALRAKRREVTSEVKKVVAPDSPLNSNRSFTQMKEMLNRFRNENTKSFFLAFDSKQYNKALRIACNAGSPEALAMTKILIANCISLKLNPNEKPDGTKPSAFDFARDKNDFYQLLRSSFEDLGNKDHQFKKTMCLIS